MAKELAETLSAIYGAYDQSNYESGIERKSKHWKPATA